MRSQLVKKPHRDVVCIQCMTKAKSVGKYGGPSQCRMISLRNGFCSVYAYQFEDCCAYQYATSGSPDDEVDQDEEQNDGNGEWGKSLNERRPVILLSQGVLQPLYLAGCWRARTLPAWINCACRRHRIIGNGHASSLGAGNLESADRTHRGVSRMRGVE